MIFYQTNKEKIISFPIFVLLFLLGHFFSIYFNVHNLILISLIIVFLLIRIKYPIMIILVAIIMGSFNANLFISPTVNNLKLEKYNLKNETVTVKGVIGNIVNRKWSQSGDLSVKKVYFKNKDLNLVGNIKFSNSSKRKLKSGDEVLVRGQLDIPRKSQNYGAFNYKLYLKTKNIFYTIKIKKKRDIIIVSNNNLSFLESIRLSFKNRILSFSKDKKISGFYLSILLGDKSYLDKELKNNMLSLGIIHLLAISGFHVAILFSIFYLFILFLLKRSLKVINKIDVFKWSLALSIMFIVFYLFLINFQTSATRAVIMISLFSLAKIFEKKFNPINILALAALIILLFNRSSFLNIGFYLSFLAVLTFFIPIKIVKVYFKHENKYKKFLFNYLLVNISIFLVTTPVLLFTFYKVSLGQIIFNLFFIPIFSFVIYPISLLSNIFKFDFLIDYNYKAFDFLVENFSGDYFFINPINTVQLISSMIILVLIFFLLLRKDIIKISFLLVLYFIVILFPINRESKGLNIYTLSVGNGDATLITKNGQSILIDAASKLRGNNGKQVIIPHLDFFNIKKIDYAIITHLDEDHYGGFIDLVNEKRIKTIVSSVDLPKELIDENIKYIKISKEKIIKISKLKIHLYPSNDFKDDNNNSIITYFEYKSKKFLFVGDSESSREKSFMKNYPEIKNIDFLKIGHHGARKSSSLKFLKYLNPKIVTISAGKNNRFKHPHKETLEKLHDLNIKYYRTDILGEIVFKFYDKIGLILPFKE